MAHTTAARLGGPAWMARLVRWAFAAAALPLLATPALAQQEGVYTIARFEFEGGGALDAMKVGYTTWGVRAADDSNVIVLVPATSGTRSWANAHIGPGKTFDPQRHFVVSIDAIGGGTSSGPRDGQGIRFPAYNIRDMVRAQHELLTNGLGLRSVLAIGGASSGAYQSLEWGVMYPGFARGLLLYVPAAKADRHVKLIVDGIVGTLGLDPALGKAEVPPLGGEAVRRAAVVYFPWLLSNEALEGMGSDEVLAKAEAGFAGSWERNWDAAGLIRRYMSSAMHDPGVPYGGRLGVALERVTGAVLVMPVSTDRTHPIAMSESMNKLLTKARVVYAPLDSPRGHGAVFSPPGTPEYVFVSERTREFLKGL